MQIIWRTDVTSEVPSCTEQLKFNLGLAFGNSELHNDKIINYFPPLAFYQHFTTVVFFTFIALFFL